MTPVTPPEPEDPNLPAALFEPSRGLVGFIPRDHFHGQDRFEFQVCDPEGSCVSAFVHLVVQSVNDLPVAVSITLTTEEDTPVAVDVSPYIADVEDADSSMTLSVSQPSGGTSTVSNVTLVYSPRSDFTGSDAFTYTACDRDGACATANVSVLVLALNDRPFASNVTGELLEDGSLSLSLLDLVADVEDDLDGADVAVVDEPLNGTLSYSPATGVALYVPDADYNGVDSFTFRVCDSRSSCRLGRVDLTVWAINDVPVTTKASMQVTEDASETIDLRLYVRDVEDSDADLQFDIVTEPVHGYATLDASTGMLRYVPRADYSGLDLVVYRVCDSEGACTRGTVDVSVVEINDSPVVSDVHGSTQEDTPFLVLTRDHVRDVDDDAADLQVSVSSSTTAHGTVSVDSRTGIMSYTPETHFHGNDSFAFTVCDVEGECDSGVVHVDVESVNNAPTVENVDATVLAGTAHVFDVLGVAADVDEADPSDPTHALDPLAVRVTSAPEHNIAFVEVADGRARIRYVAQDTTSAYGFFGTETFEYEVCDLFQECATGVATVTVEFSGPAIASVVASDPDDQDFTFSTGDEVLITFSEATNRPGGASLDADEVADLLELPSDLAASARFTAEWRSDSELALVVAECLVCADDNDALSYDVTPASVRQIFTDTFATQRIRVLAGGGLRNAAETSLPSTAESPRFTGNWGEAQPQVLTITVDTPSDVSAAESGFALPSGTRLVLTFNGPISREACTELTQEDYDLVFSQQVLSRGDGSLTADLGSIVGRWVVAGSDECSLDADNAVTVFAGAAAGANTGSVIHAASARGRRAASVPTYADSLEIVVVDASTQTLPAVSDLALFLSVDGTSLGNEFNNYMQSATQDSPQVVDVMSPDFNPVSDSSTAEEGVSIVSFVADDPNDRDEVFSVGDTFTLTFSTAVRARDVSTKQTIDEAFVFEQGGVAVDIASYEGEFTSSTTLVITMLNVTSNVVPVVGELRVRMLPDSITALDDDSVSNVESGRVLEGDFGVRPATSATYYVVPVVLFVFAGLFALYALFKQKRAEDKRKMSLLGGAGVGGAGVGVDQAWMQPPAAVTMRKAQDPFTNFDAMAASGSKTGTQQRQQQQQASPQSGVGTLPRRLSQQNPQGEFSPRNRASIGSLGFPDPSALRRAPANLDSSGIEGGGLGPRRSGMPRGPLPPLKQAADPFKSANANTRPSRLPPLAKPGGAGGSQQASVARRPGQAPRLGGLPRRPNMPPRTGTLTGPRPGPGSMPTAPRRPSLGGSMSGGNIQPPTSQPRVNPNRRPSNDQQQQ